MEVNSALWILPVLLAALLHAVWNTLVKSSGDPLVAQTVLMVTGALICLPGLFLVGWPVAEEVPYLLGGVLLHNVYFACLTNAYRLGDLSVVYPIARGTAPLFVLFLTILTGADEFSGAMLSGVVMISLGLLGLSAFGRGARGGAPVGWALATGLMVAAYTTIDGLGVRIEGNWLRFALWLHVLCPLVFVPITIARRTVDQVLRIRALPLIWGGAIATIGYFVALWAYARAPLAGVSAVRETGVLFAAILGARVLREPLGGTRILASALVAAGVILLQGSPAERAMTDGLSPEAGTQKSGARPLAGSRAGTRVGPPSGHGPDSGLTIAGEYEQVEGQTHGR